MNPLTEDLLDGGVMDGVQPTASLTSGMIKRRRAVRVATPADVFAPPSEAPSKAVKELVERVEAAFPDETPEKAPEQDVPQSAVQADDQVDPLQARQQELRRLAAERAEAQRRPLGDDAPSEQVTPPVQDDSGTGERPQDQRIAAAGPAVEASTLRAAPQAPVRQAPPAQPAPGQNSSQSPGDIQQIDPLRNGQAPGRDVPAGRRKSLVQGEMTPLERRQAAVEHHKRLTDAQAQRASNQPRDIATYWDQLRNGRQVPAMINIDPREVAQHWPNTLLISCDSSSGAASLDRSFAEEMRGARQKASDSGEVVVEYTPMVTEWIMTVGREVARAGRPIQDIEVFPTSLGNVSYRVIALPLSGERLGTVYALCYITHA
jgi:hypothetical protein